MSPPRPSLSDHVEALAAAGRIGEAYRLLSSAASAADPDALALLAEWRLAGHYVRRDLVAARDLYRGAAEAGDRDAARVHTAFVGNGTGGAADWQESLRLLGAYDFPGASAERALIDRMLLSPRGDPLEPPVETRLSDRPWVGLFPSLLTPAECDFLFAAAQPCLEPSVVVDPRTGAQHRNPVRTSDGMSFTLVREGPAVRALNRRIAAATGTDVAQGESLQVLRYRRGEEYRPHFDAVANEANQRILTMLVYLNEGYEGGETEFLKTGLSFKGHKGDALLFRNTLADGRPDPLSLHAGRPVTAGEKYLASRWIRARPFSFPPPRPLLDL